MTLSMSELTANRIWGCSPISANGMSFSVPSAPLEVTNAAYLPSGDVQTHQEPLLEKV
jgi:hypothetical protein